MFVMPEIMCYVFQLEHFVSAAAAAAANVKWERIKGKRTESKTEVEGKC